MSNLSRRSFLSASASVAAAMATADLWAKGASNRRPNVIFAMTDDQGWGDTGFNGHPFLKTPHLDDMAKNGMKLNRFYAATPKCSSTRASVITGRHPERFGFDNGTGFPTKERTVGQILSEVRYRTGIFGKWHLGRMDTSSAGFPPNLGFEVCRTDNLQFDIDPSLFHEDGSKQTHRGESSEVLVRECLKFAETSKEAQQPFAALLWFTSPHTPFDPLPKDVEAFEAMKRSKKDMGNAKYYAEIIAMDRAMGQLRKGLRDMNIEKDTIVWWCSDNGGTQESMNRPLQGTKFTCWEGGIRVPAVVEWPGRIQPGSESSVPSSTMDFLPTMAGLAGVADVKARGPLDGIDLVPLFDGVMKERPKPVPLGWYGPMGLNGNRYKIIRGNPSAKQFKKDKDSWRLFDVVKDPGEKHNLVNEEKKVFAEMKKELEAWVASVDSDPGQSKKRKKKY